MKATKATTLIIAALVAGVAGYLTATYLVTHGYPIPTSGYNLMFTLPGISIILALLALPIWHYRRQTLKLAKAKTQTVSNQMPPVKRVDPFYAVRILMLAKATSVASALFIGWHLSLVFIETSKPELTWSFFSNLFTLLGAIVALAIALVIEWICRIPEGPDSLEQQPKLKSSPIDPAMSKEWHD